MDTLRVIWRARPPRLKFLDQYLLHEPALMLALALVIGGLAIVLAP